jgi:G3E family GTPase
VIRPRIPLSLITGFLGSGKTTLIAALLKQPEMEGSAVIVNEFGAVGIDDAVYAQSMDSSDIVLLGNGCLCCAAGDDLAATVWALATRPDPPRRIVIETSGLADPAPVLRRLIGDPRLRQAIRLDAVVATIDALNGARDLAERPLASRQCSLADRRLITKTDLVEPAAAQDLAERLAALNPGSAVEFASHGEIAAGKLFGASLYDPKSGHADADRWLNLEGYRVLPRYALGRSDVRFSGAAAHDASVGAWLVEEARPMDWRVLSPRLGTIVARHGDRLLRLKGLIHTIGDERPLAIHGVQRVFNSPLRLERWTRSPMTSLVAIGDEGVGPAIVMIADALADSAAAANDSRAVSQASLEHA